ncbi:MAG: DUF697 domain-containing protein [SAR324 cluster bacterium]|nr:DUF697 domain-containing protein [SAR324 cluster bacterium]
MDEIKANQVLELNAEKIINNNVLWAMGLGIIPLPLISLAGTSVVQLRMIFQLSELYGVEFSENRVKLIIGALAGGLGTAVLAQSAISLLKPIPFVNSVAVIGGIPLMMGATTYGLGKVFDLHFSSGGTLLDFDFKKLRAYFVQQIDDGKKVAATLKRKSTASG